MNANLVRALMHLAGLAVAIALFFLLPFSPLVNGFIAMAFGVVDGVVAEAVFRRLATPEERLRDLRERVDIPPE